MQTLKRTHGNLIIYKSISKGDRYPFNIQEVRIYADTSATIICDYTLDCIVNYEIDGFFTCSESEFFEARRKAYEIISRGEIQEPKKDDYYLIKISELLTA